jgi:uncharacterized Tic20 family protein
MDTPPPIQPPAPEAPAVNSNDKLLAVLCHGCPLIGLGLILPLIVYLVKKDEGGFVADQAKEALNFHITLLIAAVACAMLMLVAIGALLLPVVGLAALIFAIVAIIKVMEGKAYLYPVTLRLIK